ncbi:hypothetical protein F3J24_11510 [Comamonas sp. Tr-654]|uniref:DUF799 domain-containing protein n=1 Tax=Comamonas sp. Tr-654 TaxID=2608341 RepID=UPI001420D52D|nr:DUF799 domain-containing protein [Comamonas sp. Tr-654]NIF84125.1 hypothetical protein [Comamonas sp. Tr-654]
MQPGIFFRVLGLAAAVALTGCATNAPYDYSALRNAKPASILVLPPVNHSPEVNAPAGVLSQISLPMAEAGYYVLPVAVTDEMFRQNGIVSAEDAQELPVSKLQKIFGADAALYLEIKSYGTSYAVISSSTTVTLEAKLVDLRTGTQLWDGRATASSAEGQNSGGGLAGMLITALLNQIVDTVSDRSVQISAIASQRLISPAMPRGLLAGPRSPSYVK